VAVRWSLGVGVVLAFALCAAAQEPAGCLLFDPAGESSPSAQCISCHRQHMGAGNHAVDVDYAPLQGAGLRPIDEVHRRGVKVPSGQVRCTTCHDARSPWKHRIALPPGARALRAVDLRDRTSYEGPPRAAQPGEAVATKPLCLACHALD
jgi:hypothetical protein